MIYVNLHVRGKPYLNVYIPWMRRCSQGSRHWFQHLRGSWRTKALSDSVSLRHGSIERPASPAVRPGRSSPRGFFHLFQQWLAGVPGHPGTQSWLSAGSGSFAGWTRPGRGSRRSHRPVGHVLHPRLCRVVDCLRLPRGARDHSIEALLRHPLCGLASPGSEPQERSLPAFPDVHVPSCHLARADRQLMPEGLVAAEERSTGVRTCWATTCSSGQPNGNLRRCNPAINRIGMRGWPLSGQYRAWKSRPHPVMGGVWPFGTESGFIRTPGNGHSCLHHGVPDMRRLAQSAAK